MSVPPVQVPHDPVALDEPRVTIEMDGPNIVIRSSASIDREYTTSLVHAVNAASDTRTVVVIDPDPIRCDDAFAGAPLPRSEVDCAEHRACRPTDVEVVGSGIIRVAAEHGWWLVDVARGRFCRAGRPVDAHFVDASAWTPVIAVCLTPTRVRALLADGSRVTAVRAHDERRPALTA